MNNKTVAVLAIASTVAVILGVAAINAHADIRTTEIVEKEQTKRCLSNNRWRLLHVAASWLHSIGKSLSRWG